MLAVEGLFVNDEQNEAPFASRAGTGELEAVSCRSDPGGHVELELARHSWTDLHGVGGEAGVMPRLVLDLVRAEDRAQAEEACRRINALVFSNGLLSQVSPALASALVHGLWHRGEHSEDLILQRGLADSGLRDRSILFLAEAAQREDLAQFRSVVRNSLNELRAAEGG